MEATKQRWGHIGVGGGAGENRAKPETHPKRNPGLPFASQTFAWVSLKTNKINKREKGPPSTG